jgi:lipopolysaccharide transport system ATP-binding protein
MTEPTIAIEKLSKSYLIRHQSSQNKHETFREAITDGIRGFARNAINVLSGKPVVQRDETEKFWALKNVNFEIGQGEAIGIIGPNGAGKSTLLKILSHITDPTEGRVTLRGRVTSLLEVGTGFHPELTGRENVFLNGAILGMKRNEIRRTFDEIVAFAEVDKFLDTPVKWYSSGMFVRLAFAVAAHLRPDILIVDEVLSVGDAEFQKKCIRKMDEICRRDGRTALFVSHNMGAIKNLCRRVIWIQQGSVRGEGFAQTVINDYLRQSMPSMERLISLTELPRQSSDDNRLRLESLEWLCDLPLRHGECVKARIRFKTRRPLHEVTVGIGFSEVGGQRLLTYETDFPDGNRPNLLQPGNYFVDFEVESLPLAPNTYALDVGCRSGDWHSLDYIPAAVVALEVISGPTTSPHITQSNAGVSLPIRSSWSDAE